MPAYAYTQTIDPTPRRIYSHRVSTCIAESTLEEAIAELTRISNVNSSFAMSNIEFVSDGYTDPEMEIYFYRMETPEEVAERVQKAEQYNQQVREQRRQQYLQLKQEFEGEGQNISN